MRIRRQKLAACSCLVGGLNAMATAGAACVAHVIYNAYLSRNIRANKSFANHLRGLASDRSQRVAKVGKH